MKPRSAKNKGRRLQKELQEQLLQKAPQLEPDDIRCAIMGESGEDLKFSPAARRVFPYSFECKNVEKLNIWSALKQAEENTKVGLQPAVVFRRNHSDAYVAIKLEHFLTLISPKSTLDETTTS